MSQDRRDIDRIYDILYKDGVLILVPFADNSQLRKYETLDGILDAFGLLNLEERVTDLENRVTDLEE